MDSECSLLVPSVRHHLLSVPLPSSPRVCPLSSSPWGLAPPLLPPYSNSVFLLFFVTKQVVEATESGKPYSYLIETLKKELVCIKRLFDKFVVSQLWGEGGRIRRRVGKG